MRKFHRSDNALPPSLSYLTDYKERNSRTARSPRSRMTDGARERRPNTGERRIKVSSCDENARFIVATCVPEETSPRRTSRISRLCLPRGVASIKIFYFRGGLMSREKREAIYGWPQRTRNINGSCNSYSVVRRV